MTLGEQMLEMGRRARGAADVLRNAPAEQRSHAISAMARQLRARAPDILAANAADLAVATQMVDRLRLDEERLEAIASSVDQVAGLPDLVGAEVARWRRPNGLDIARVQTPIGAIGMIFESRPNVAAEAAAICLRSANSVILRGGSDALRSCLAIHAALAAGLAECSLPPDAVQMVPTFDRAAVGLLLEGLGGAIDLIIPRGGRDLVARVQAEARVPVLGHLEGVCHTYVHSSAEASMAVEVVLNAKTRRPSVCGATETLLIDRAVAAGLLPLIADALCQCGVELRADTEAAAVLPKAVPADESDWGREYLAPIIAIRIVDGLDAAVSHIATYGSGHTEAIIAADTAAAERFLRLVDSAIVIWNASTQFADGGEFGFGAEIGISTSRLHARGPVGPEQLLSFKYVVRGSGQIRG